MRVFIDTNILIDFVVNREGFSEDADKLFALGITGDIKLMTSALSYVTTMYIAHKYEYLEGTKRSVYLRVSPKIMEEPRIEIVR